MSYRLPMRRVLPNLITLTRLCAVPVLGWLAYVHDARTFAWLLTACLLGDVVDGVLARALHASTPLGAQLDSVADSLLFFAAIAGALVFHQDEVMAHRAVFIAVPLAWTLENVAALARYGRLSSFHTYLSRTAAVAMGLFIVVLFLDGLRARLLYAAAGLVLVATLEECALLWMLPEWRANVRGLYWVLRERQQGRSR